MRTLSICIAAAVLTSGCWAKDPACSVIKTANEACTIIEYQGEDGRTHQVRVTPGQVEQLAREGAEKDGKPAPKSAVPAKE